MPKLADFKTNEKSWWCPGCGDFGVLAALQKALVDLGVEPHNVALVAGIGCSGKIGNYINCYNLHVVHGRALPAAMGLKLANRSLTVIAAGGDGDGYAIGAGHFLHAVRRNVDITYIVMDNQIYGLTKGQMSPTSHSGFKTRTSPEGNIERPVRPLQLAIAAGATFVASGFSSDVKQLSRLIAEGIRHRGFALVNVYSPCVTFNRLNTYDWYKEVLSNLDDDPTYDPTNRAMALERLIETDERVRGLVYRSDQPSFEQLFPGYRDEPIVGQDWTLPEEDFTQLLEQFR
ncbi:MAG: 2-oxoacid:ferredoxin oxidoreductase subunit beta [Firmicutes bacterium]|nr:2-oxoacid:ferredoxin oxidoreductase subunit beta [Bacillota bacterium]